MVKDILQRIEKISHFLKNFDLEELLFIQRFGIPKNKANIIHLRKNNFKNMPAPIFFLSTGRCGTNWFTSLFKGIPGIKVFHEPKPNFGIQGVRVYNYLKNSNFQIDTRTEDLIKEIFISGREQYLRYSYKSNQRYIETNNQITFFAPVLEKLFPTAKFIHLYRHPGEFVRSAIRRHFYSPDNIADLKRITPENLSNWESYSEIEKSSWLWNETNTFIEKFKKNCDDSKYYSFNFNKLYIDNIANLLDFLNIDINKERIQKKMLHKKNIQTKNSFPDYNNWNQTDKDELSNICCELAEKYGYEL